MAVDEHELRWALVSADEAGRKLSLIYEGSPGVRARRAELTQGDRTVRLVLLTTDRTGRASIQYISAQVELPFPLGDRALLGSSHDLARAVESSGLTGMDDHTVPASDSPA